MSHNIAPHCHSTDRVGPTIVQLHTSERVDGIRFESVVYVDLDSRTGQSTEEFVSDYLRDLYGDRISAAAIDAILDRIYPAEHTYQGD